VIRVLGTVDGSGTAFAYPLEEAVACDRPAGEILVRHERVGAK
jgi:hypothetical protein